MNHCHRRLAANALLAVAALLGSPAFATQHLVTAGDGWDDLAERATPGDEIILMPGVHEPATLENLEGTAERPIVIRALDPARGITIEADRYGLRLRRPRHVEVRDITITGARIHGLVIDAGDRIEETLALPGHDAGGPAPFGHVTIRNVSVMETGPRGQRHAVVIDRVEDVRLEGCRIEAWAGTGIEIVASRGVRIEDTNLEGRAEFTQLSGIRCRAGTERVVISGCRFVNPGDQGVCIGGGSKPSDFARPLDPGAEPGSLFEARDVDVERCVFVGGHCAVAFVNCERANVQRCTITGPTHAIFSVRREQEAPGFGGVRACTVGNSISTWQPGALPALTHVGPGADLSGIGLEQNLWWSADLAETREALGPLPGEAHFPQVMDIDPKLDDALRPQVTAAEIFGVHSE